MYRFALIICLFFTASCSKRPLGSWMEKNGKIKVLSTTAMIGDIVKEIGGDHIDHLTLITGEIDPHSYELVKGDSEKLSSADVVFCSGLGLEHGASLHETIQNHINSFSLGDILWENNPKLFLQIDGQIDPHIWMDVSIWAKIIEPIVNEFIRIDPLHADEFNEKGQTLHNEMIQLDYEMKNLLEKIPANKRYLVTSHDAFFYFTKRYLSEKEEGDHWKNRFSAPEGLAPDGQLSTYDIQQIIKHINEFDIKWVFPESNVSSDSLKKVLDASSKMNMRVSFSPSPLYGDAMGQKGSEAGTYLGMMRYNAKTISEVLNDSP